MNFSPNSPDWDLPQSPVAWSWRSVQISSNLFFSRLHGVSWDVWCVLWLRYARDDSNSNLQCWHLKRYCWVDTLWLFCLFIERRLSYSSACRLNCVALCTFTLLKRFPQVKQERTQNMKTYSRRSRERDSFPDIAYSLSTGIATDNRWWLKMKCTYWNLLKESRKIRSIDRMNFFPEKTIS